MAREKTCPVRLAEWNRATRARRKALAAQAKRAGCAWAKKKSLSDCGCGK